MSKKYLYNFGYEEPSERRSNVEAGTDFESSAAVYVIADNEEQALEWGHEISERFVCLLYRDDRISWKNDGFAAWIEHDPDQLLGDSTDSLTKIPVVRRGEYPDFAIMLSDRS
jgi:hypothetical protein